MKSNKKTGSKLQDNWTKKELSLRVGYKELAMAVIEQWKADGKPEAELIPFWVEVISECQKEANNVH